MVGRRKLPFARFFFSATLSVSVITTAANSETCSRELTKPLRQHIQETLASHPDIPGAVVGIYHPQIGYSVSAFGTHDLANEVAMSVDMAFDIGSVHKLFKWILLEKIAQAGDIQFSESITDYVDIPDLGGLPIDALAYHSTGMVDIGLPMINDALDRFRNGGLPYQYPIQDIVGFLHDETGSGVERGYIQNFNSGTDFHYSSYGATIAGEVASTTQGKPIDALMQEFILEPLSLNHTGLIGYQPLPENLAQGYGSAEQPDPSEPFGIIPPDLLAAISSAHGGAMYSTACDLVQFSHAISDPDLGFLSEEMITSRIAKPIGNETTIEVGRGVFRYPAFDADSYWVHLGDGIHSHSSLVGYDPSTGVTVAILANLKPKFIRDEYGFHFDVLSAIHGHTGP